VLGLPFQTQVPYLGSGLGAGRVQGEIGCPPLIIITDYNATYVSFLSTKKNHFFGLHEERLDRRAPWEKRQPSCLPAFPDAMDRLSRIKGRGRGRHVPTVFWTGLPPLFHRS
jgi:hypothetical protein